MQKLHTQALNIKANPGVFADFTFRVDVGMHDFHGANVIWERGGEVTLGQQQRTT